MGKYKLFLLAVSGLLIILSCSKKNEIPEITNPDNPIVDGQAISPKDFYDKYCKLTPTHETCIAIEIAIRKSDTKKSLSRKTSTKF